MKTFILLLAVALIAAVNGSVTTNNEAERALLMELLSRVADTQDKDIDKAFNDDSTLEKELLSSITSPLEPAEEQGEMVAQAQCGGASRYCPVFKFDGSSRSYCYPDWPTKSNDGRCITSLNHHNPIFYQINTCGDKTVYTYWLWYGKQKGCFANLGEHGNDWEHVSVFVNSKCTISSVVFHQHGGHYTRRAGKFDTQGGRPVVYIGKVAHGSYHASCDGKCSFWEFITKGCLGSVNYCQGGCLYWDDYRNPGPSLSGTLHPLQPGKNIDGITRPNDKVCGIGSCDGKSYRGAEIGVHMGCWQNAP